MARYMSLYEEAAKKYGLSPTTLATFARIESGHNPNVRTGSYRGLFQLSPQQFRRFGGTGSIFDPRANTMAGAAKIANLKFQFVRRFGREPNMTELYMMHQQGPGGAAAHLSNPNQPAWKSMYSTAEGRQKGPAWAKRAIWGNVPNDVKRRYGSVENMTSADFVNMWDAKINRFSGEKPERTALANAVIGNASGTETGPEMITSLPTNLGPTGTIGTAGPAQMPPLPTKATPSLSFSQKMGEYWSHPVPSGPAPWDLADALTRK